ncbi:MAG: gliding motility-associated-like protein [Vicingaceae bacterium]|jgi:gliding motility-associated-like protein
MTKKGILFLILYNIILASFSQTGSGVSMGGEISWRCLPNGQYIFSITQYAPCNRGRLFQGVRIDISSSRLPLSSPNGPVVDRILLSPDLVRIQASNNGDTSPQCTPYQNQPFSCSRGDSGMVQAIYYESNPISLYGIPPSDGWEFTTNMSNMSTNIDNLFPIGIVFLFRAKMYAGPNGLTSGPCFDSSPTFSARPATYICRGYEFTYNHTAIDEDLDSLGYSWDQPYVNPPFIRVPARYNPRFSPTNPTPDQSFNINNIPASLDPLTGVTKLAVYSGIGVKRYWTTVQVDSYREGVKISTVYREIPITIFDCPDLPVSTNLPNNAPEVLINGVPNSSVVTNVTAGQTVSIPIQVVDNDRISVAPFSQLITMVPEGILFTQSKNGPSKKFPGDPVGQPCNITGIDVNPCAYLRGNPAPFIDPTATPPITVVKGLGVIGVEFVWQTDCKHILSPTKTPGANEGIYNFVMRVQDDHCPVPGINYPTVTVRVKDPLPLTEPIMKGVSVLLDGTTRYSWVPPIDSARQFNPPDKQNDHYESTSSTPRDGQPPLFWQSRNAFITNYQQDKRDADFTPYNFNNVQDPNSGYNILESKDSHRGIFSDYYVRMRTLSGCTDTNASIWSEPARIMELAATPVGVAPNPIRSTARLTWNRAKPMNAKTYSYFVYESPTHFYIHANDSISQGGVANTSNWYTVGDTNATTFNVGATTCSDYVGFRVEARDTVITWKEGSAIQGDSLDTLYFSTFSTIDTLFMEARSGIPDPSFDTLAVRADGTVFLRINLRGKLTTGRYNIYSNSIDPNNLLTSVNALTDSVVVLTGADLNSQNIIIEAVDACNAANTTNSAIYTTILPTGSLTNSCAGEYTLNWNEPTGFPTNIVRYNVYADVGDGNGFQLDTIVTDRTITNVVIDGVSRGRTLRYKVEAIDARGAVNSSAIHEYTAPANLATDDLVGPPIPRCTYVNADGSVTLSWVPAKDTVNNFANYNIQYKRASVTAWTQIALNDDDNLIVTDSTYTITGINAQNEQYDFEITSLAGCDGKQFSAYNEISSIYLSASPRQGVPQAISDLTWNPAGPDYTGLGNFFTLFGAQNGQALTTIGTADFGGMSEEIVQLDTCILPVSYRLNYTDNAFIQEGFSCEVQSSVANAVHVDTVPPEAENLAMLTFDRGTNQLRAYWLGTAAGADSLEFLRPSSSNFLTDSAVWINYNSPIRNIAFPQSILDATDTVRMVGARAKDKCNNTAVEPIAYHKSMDVEVEWKACDSTNLITWNQYVGLNPIYAVEYEVFFSTDGGVNWQAAPNSLTVDSTYNHLITQGNITYQYYIRAKSLDPNAPQWLTPESNVDSVFSNYEDTPLYYYLTYATVLEDNRVEVEYYRDTLAPVKNYAVFRGNNATDLTPIAFINANSLGNQDRFSFVDETADGSAQEYYYQVASQNDCENITSMSNFGRTIHLTVESNDEGMKNTLRWNKYLDWDSTVAHYNIYRTSSRFYSTTVYQQVAPNSAEDFNVFVDDISSAINSNGKFYYRVEAVQGPFNAAGVNGYPNNLTSEVSNSNIAEALQGSFMYVPNAFAPDGVNKTFGPKGQFFDLTRFEMSIYNRWGEQIYQTNDINLGWDGTIGGKDAALGSYVYIIRYVASDGKEKQKKGTLTLIR